VYTSLELDSVEVNAIRTTVSESCPPSRPEIEEKKWEIPVD
jgi:hypothetical protein